MKTPKHITPEAAEVAAELHRLAGDVKASRLALREALFRAYVLGGDDAVRVARRHGILRSDSEIVLQ
jgi:hypothetical protein